MIPVLIVPVLNRYDLLQCLLDSIDYPVQQVIVVDNGGQWQAPVGQRGMFGSGHTIRLPHNLGMSCFAITRLTLAKVGYFDENFHPAYDEDLDWHRRAILAGSRRVEVHFTGTHVGSATIHSDPSLRRQNGPTHQANDRYYAQKWGGNKQGGERYSTPFDRGGHVGDWRLESERLATQSWKKE